jgi:hypothetical protein
MSFELPQLGMTLVAGASAIVVVFCAYAVATQRRHAFRSALGGTWLSKASILGLSLMCGVAVNAAADKFGDGNSPWMCRLFGIDTDGVIKRVQLFREVGTDWFEPKSLCRELLSERHSLRLTGRPPDDVRVRLRDLPVVRVRERIATEVTSGLYYGAKQAVFEVATHFAELSELEKRISFARSMMSIAGLGLALAAVVLVVFASHVARRRPIAHWSVRAFLFSLVVLAAVGKLFAELYQYEEGEFDKRVLGYAAVMIRDADGKPPADAAPAAAPVVRQLWSVSTHGISGLAPLLQDDARFDAPFRVVAVHDERDDRSTSRLTVYELSETSLEKIHEVRLKDAGLSPLPRDLEAVVALPPTPSIGDVRRATERRRSWSLLLVESGSEGPPADRVMLATLRDGDRWTAEVEVVGRHELRNVEGAVIAPDGDGLLLKLAKREAGGTGPGLHSFHLTRDGRSLTPTKKALEKLDAYDVGWMSAPGRRVCSELAVDAFGTAWIAATQDPSPRGPFRSRIMQGADVGG